MKFKFKEIRQEILNGTGLNYLRQILKRLTILFKGFIECNSSLMNHAFTSKKLFSSLLENISVKRLGLFSLSLKFCNYKIIP